jgi:hypothetical protein
VLFGVMPSCSLQIDNAPDADGSTLHPVYCLLVPATTCIERRDGDRTRRRPKSDEVEVCCNVDLALFLVAAGGCVGG